MKTLRFKFIVALSLILFLLNTTYAQFANQWVNFDPNNISTYFLNTGIFNRNPNSTNTPGFEWPKGSTKYVLYLQRVLQ